ncbi:hypothetical protein RI367_006424 [Sorochytrium milnesiophthora]
MATMRDAWLSQCGALVRKHALVLRRSPVLLLLSVLGPALMILVSSASSSALYEALKHWSLPDVLDATQPVQLKHDVCPSLSCRPVYYFTPNDPYHASIMDAFAQVTTLTSGQDIIGFASTDDMLQSFYDNSRQLAKRSVALTVTFTTFVDGDAVHSVADAANRMGQLNLTTYNIGATGKQPINIDPTLPLSYGLNYGTAAKAKVALDTCIIAVRQAILSGKQAGDNGKISLLPSDIPDIGVSLATFPSVTFSDGRQGTSSRATTESDDELAVIRRWTANIVTSTVMSAGFFPLVLLLGQVAAQDKHNAHLGVLRKLSLFESAYWASLTVVLLVLSTCAAALSVAAAKIAGASYYLFGNTDLFVVFLLQLLFALSLCALGLLGVAALSHPYATTTFTVLVVVGCALMCLMLDCIGAHHNVDTPDPLVTANDPVYAGEWFNVYANSAKAFFLSLLPFFHYGRLVAEIGQATAQNNFTAPFDFGSLSISHGPFSLSTDEQSHLRQSYRVPPASLSFIWMAVQFVLYTLLCYLLNQLVTGRSGGASRPLPFLRQKGGASLSPVDAHLVEQSRQSNSVIVANVTKSFGTLTAVNDICMTMHKGRCLALLGHNGAGKSTLINMLSGLLSPTSGNAYVFGHALTHDTMPIQRMLGTCPQDDIQYPQLSAREHLRLYARFKDIPSANLNEYIDERLDLVGLLDHADQPVGEFSGGMKRRLSIVSAAIGDPQFIILDEPTTGMDPINRRKVWQYIARLKRDSVLLLTSHSMEETDALGDDICIIDHGQVQAIGTSLQLKNAHGTGYRINLLTWEGRIDELCAYVSEVLPQAHVSASTATSLSVVVGSDDMARLPTFLSKLQTTMRLPQNERVVKDWGLQNASLEQVFLKLTRKSEDEGADPAATTVEGNSDGDAHKDALPRMSTAGSKLPTQVWAVIAKNVAYQRRQAKTNLLMLFVLIGLLAAMHPVLHATGSYTGSMGVCPEGHSEFVIPPSLDSLTQSPRASIGCSVPALRAAVQPYMKACKPSTLQLCNPPDYADFKQVDWIDNGAPAVWVSGANDTVLSVMRSQTSLRYLAQSPTLAQWGTAAGVNTSTDAISRTFDLVPTDPSFVDRVRAAQVAIRDASGNGTSVCHGAGYLPVAQDPMTAVSALRQEFPDRAIAFAPAALQATIYYYTIFRSYPFTGYLLPPQGQADGQCPDSNASSPQTTALGLLRSIQASQSGPVPRQDLLLQHTIAGLTNTWAQMLLGPTESIQSSFTALALLTYPVFEQLMASTFVLLVSLWLFPVYLMVPFVEREEHLFAYFQVNGLSTLAYWLGNYAYCMLLSLPLLTATAISVQLYFAKVTTGWLLLVLLLSAHATIGLAFLYASVTRASPMARLMAYVMPIVMTLPVIFIVFGDAIALPPLTSTWPCLVPPIAFARGLRVVLEGVDMSALGAPLSMLTVVGFVCIALAAMFTSAAGATVGILARIRSMATERNVQETACTETATTVPAQDGEVLQEIKRVDNNEKHDAQLAVKIQHLSKYYGNFAAVDDLTLGMDKGECFGLLGPNGSGKTTTVTMLGGTLAPSKGRATVGGIDIRDPRLPSVLGLCPQENRVMRDLTVEENLLFFARVRGASRKMAQAYARQAASIVGLTGAAYTRAAEHLSGGMRRRLSIAVALIGLPPVIILDEPTTGLDPGNRMQIWDIIAKVRDRREHCIILISHLMEEVDALTSRIGIMAAGSLRCLGNQVSLKNRFASGYTLYVQMNVSAPTEIDSVRELHQAEAAHIDRVAHFVHSQVCSDAVLRTGGAYNLGETAIDPQARSWTASFQFRLPRSVDLARVFTKMEQGAAQLGVVEWSLNQSSLEDVFVEVAMPYIK